MKKIFFVIISLYTLNSFAQVTQPDTTKIHVQIVSVDAAKVKAIAKKTDKKHTLFYTFGIWCEPCRLHLPDAIKLAKEHDIEFYVLLVDSQKSDRILMAASFIKEIDKDVKIAVLSDAAYGERMKKRNRTFLTEITPPQFKNIPDFSKYILLDGEGNVIMVTNWKDNEGDWKDDTDMVKKKIVPLL